MNNHIIYFHVRFQKITDQTILRVRFSTLHLPNQNTKPAPIIQLYISMELMYYRLMLVSKVHFHELGLDAIIIKA